MKNVKVVSAKKLVKDIDNANGALFEASRLNAKKFFSANQSKEALVEHFLGRMANERMNMVEISKQISEMPANTSAEELEMLSRQAHDEAVHFKMVKEVIEHITGADVDVDAALAKEATLNNAKGASIISDLKGEDKEIALAVYQMVAEGRAEVVWNQMADSIKDSFISSRYTKIAKDEGFHATIGKKKLEEIALDSSKHVKIMEIVERVRKDLYDISCKNTMVSNKGIALVSEAYGW
jgi:rubrerythrin